MKTLEQNPSEDNFVQDPYPFYDIARTGGPLFFWQDYNLVCATSHATVTQILKSRDMGREIPPDLADSIPDHLKPFYDIEAHSMLELEPPRHTRLRSLVVRAFTSRRVRSLESEMTQVCHDLIDAFPTESFDLLEAYARWVPVRIICRLLGVPECHSAQLLTWSNDMVAMYQAGRTSAQETRAAESSAAFAEFMRTIIAQKKVAPGDDLLTELIRAEEAGDRLSEKELVSTCILLLNAGHEATVHTIGNGVATLLTKGITEVSEAVVEEILRYDPPLHMFTRWVYKDVEIAGHRFRPGDKVACLLAAANRDPEAFDDPAAFRTDRKGAQNVSFGAGIHFCVGAPLARLELLIALRTLKQRCPTLWMTAKPSYANIYHFHGLSELMVQL